MGGAFPPLLIGAGVSDSVDTLKIFDDMHLQVGDRIQLVSMLEGKKVISFTSLIGFDLNKHIFVHPPKANRVDVALQVGETLDVVVFSGVAIFVFQCKVEAVYEGPHRFIVLSFPSKIQSTRLRKEPRAKVKLPVSIKLSASEASEPVSALVCDLSISGAMIESECQLGAIGENIDIKLRVKLKTTEQELAITNRATVRNLEEVDARGVFRHGVQFNNLRAMEMIMLQNFVYEAIINSRKMSDWR